MYNRQRFNRSQFNRLDDAALRDKTVLLKGKGLEVGPTLVEVPLSSNWIESPIVIGPATLQITHPAFTTVASPAGALGPAALQITRPAFPVVGPGMTIGPSALQIRHPPIITVGSGLSIGPAVPELELIYIVIPTERAVSTDVRRTITEAFATCTETLTGVWEVNLEEFRGLQKIVPDQNGTIRCVFNGFVPDTDYAMEYTNNQTHITAYDHGWYLPNQFVPLDSLTLPATQNPVEYILMLLGGDAWATTTGIRPYRILNIPDWGTVSKPAKEFRFTAETPKYDAIKEIADYYGMIFLVKWQNTSYNVAVDSPRPNRRLVRIEAEDYNSGGRGVGYWDTDTKNEGGAYRNDGVDIEFFSNEAGYNIGWIRDDEWVKYTRSFPWTGRYALQFRVASMGRDTFFDVFLDGVWKFKVMVGRDYYTGSYQNFVNTNPDRDPNNLAYIDVTEGEHTLMIKFGGNHEDVTPSIMHQNLGRIDCIPQSAGEPDVGGTYETVAFFIPEDEIDSNATGLDLPPPLTVTKPDSFMKSGFTVTRAARERFNRIYVRGKTDTNPPVTFVGMAQTARVTNKKDLPLEHTEEAEDCHTPAQAQARAAALLQFYQMDQRSYRVTFQKRLDLQLYQKVTMSGYPQITTMPLRIVEIETHLEKGKVASTVSLIPDQKFSAQRRLARMLFPTSLSNTQAIVDKTIAMIPGNLVATIVSVSNGKAVVNVESGGQMTWRCA